MHGQGGAAGEAASPQEANAQASLQPSQGTGTSTQQPLLWIRIILFFSFYFIYTLS